MRLLCSIARVRYASKAHILNVRFVLKRTRQERVRRYAYRCVDAAVRNRQNRLRPSSPLWPVATRRVHSANSDLTYWFTPNKAHLSIAYSKCRHKKSPLRALSILALWPIFLEAFLAFARFAV
jgi:hypothetical protein